MNFLEITGVIVWVGFCVWLGLKTFGINVKILLRRPTYHDLLMQIHWMRTRNFPTTSPEHSLMLALMSACVAYETEKHEAIEHEGEKE